MPLRTQEVVVGNVAYFDHKVLLNNPEIDRNDDGLDRPGPFVCVQVVGDRSVWCAVSTTWKRKRLPLLKEWCRGGDDQWREEQQYLVDGLNTYLGPTTVFVHAAAAERPFAPFVRPTISDAGIAEVLKEIHKQGGPLLPAAPGEA